MTKGAQKDLLGKESRVASWLIASACIAVLGCRGDDPQLPASTGLVIPEDDAGRMVQITPVDSGDGGMPIVTQPCPAPSATDLDDVVQLDAAADFACAVRRSGSVICWGRNDVRYRVMGAVPAAVPKPVVIDGLAGITRVDTGVGHACALDGMGKLSCWGSNLVGEAGLGTSGDLIYPPQPVKDLTGVRKFGVGSDHVCAATEDRVLCWGDTSRGRTGQPAGAPLTTATKVMGLPSGEPVFVAAGEASCTVVKTGPDTSATYCWGSNYDGQLGTGDRSDADFPTPQLVSAFGSRALEISLAPLRFGCARAQGLALTCWGHNTSGSIGDVLPGSPVRSPLEAYPSVLGADLLRVSSHGRNTCVVTKEGHVACMGANDAGQLGLGTSDANDHGVPSFVRASRTGGEERLAKAFDVAVGGTTSKSGFVCAAIGERPECGGRVQCWGSNQYGQLGNSQLVDGNNPDATEPFPVRVLRP